jgi:hypothetical protein
VADVILFFSLIKIAHFMDLLDDILSGSIYPFPLDKSASFECSSAPLVNPLLSLRLPIEIAFAVVLAIQMRPDLLTEYSYLLGLS